MALGPPGPGEFFPCQPLLLATHFLPSHSEARQPVVSVKCVFSLGVFCVGCRLLATVLPGREMCIHIPSPPIIFLSLKSSRRAALSPELGLQRAAAWAHPTQTGMWAGALQWQSLGLEEENRTVVKAWSFPRALSFLNWG